MKKQSSLNVLGSAIMLFVLCMTFIGCSEAGLRLAVAAEMPTTEIKIDNFSFTPAVLTVPAGTKVTWTNRDDIPHNIVSSEQKFKSKPLDTDDAYSFTFTEPGTHQYFCGLHPKMVGKVVVEPRK
jgi:amicyanin